MRGIVFAIFHSAEALGFVSAFFFGDWWSYFPVVPIDQPGFLGEFAIRHYVIGGLLVVVALIDYYTFYNYPMQRCIILGKSERSTTENCRLLELSQTTPKENIFSEFFKGEKKTKMGFSVSFLQVLSMRPIQIVLVGGALRHVADYFAFALVGVSSSFLTSTQNFAPYFFGQIGGYLIAGLGNDLLFSNYQFLLMSGWNVFTILWNLWEIIFPNHNMEYRETSLCLFGIASGFSDMFIMWLLPMSFADKNRMFAYELTMFGTILALVVLTSYFATSLFGSVTIEFIKNDIHLEQSYCRLFIILFVSVSTAVFWNSAKDELKGFFYRRRLASQSTNTDANRGTQITNDQSRDS